MKHSKPLLVVFVILLGLFQFTHIYPIHAAGNTYYVSTTGNDSNPGTQSSPWRTVAKVNNFNLQPGDTVLFNKGNTWSEQLIPKSGTGESTRITYGAYGTGNKPKLTSFQAIGKLYITVTDLEFNTSSSNAVLLSNSHHITLQNCTIYSTATSWAPALQLTSNSHHNRVIGCDIALKVPAHNDAVNLRLGVDYNLMEGNTISIVGNHLGLSIEGNQGSGDTAHYNVIRKNTIVSTGGSTFGLAANSHWNVVEDNVISGAGSIYSYARHEGSFKLITQHNIVRRNIIKDNRARDGIGIGMDVYAYGGVINEAAWNHVYNNVVTNILPGGNALSVTTNGSPGASAHDNFFKNNAVYNNGGAFYQTDVDGSYPEYTKNAQMRVAGDSVIRDNYFTENLFYRFDDANILWIGNSLLTVDGAQSANSALYQRNLQLDPLLDADQRPKNGSPVIDAGSHLTYVTSASGSGSTLAVADAGYFTDGFGIVQGDTIQVGSQTATITSINYTTNTLTLNKSISWTQNQGISLPYNGSKPDIGVYEYGGAASPTGSASPAPSPSTTPSPSFSKCDQNHDNSINVLDLQSLANVILGKTVCSFTCDLNQDSSVNVLDLQYLANVILGKNACQ